MGDRLWEAIVALGVVDVEGRNKVGNLHGDLLQGRDIGREERKELNNNVQ